MLFVVVLVGVVAGVRAYRVPSRQETAISDSPEHPGLVVDAGSAAERIAEAVRIPTVSGADSSVFRDFHAFLASSFPRVFRNLTNILELENPSLAICLEWRGRDASLAPILFLAHQDVVPVEAETESVWTVPPFEGRMVEGFVYGRGSMDDKGSLIAILAAAESLLTSGYEPQRTLYLAFGHDEEIGGEGARHIAEVLRQRDVRLAFVLDEGMAVTQGYMPGFKGPVALIGIAEKGSALVELVAKTAGGHASMPPRPSASGILARAIVDLEGRPMDASLEGPTGRMLEFLAPEAPFPMRVVFANLWLFGSVVEANLAKKPATDATMRTTTSVVRLESGVKENVVPSEARAVVSYRIRPGETSAHVLHHVKSTVDTTHITVTLLPESREPSPVSDPESSSFRVVARSIRRVFPEAIVAPALVLGGTDSRHFTEISDAVYRFVPLRFLPGDDARVHGTNERVTKENAAEMIRFYYEVISAASESF